MKCADDRIVFTGVAPSTVARKLRGRTIQAIGRKGKYLWFELDERPWPVFHYGMTGSFKTPETQALQLESGPDESAENNKVWPPRFTKIHFVTTEGRELVMTNARRLGRIRLQQDP